jgi:hypothetical protein
MELNVYERLLILNLDTLPKVGNIVTMRVKQQLLNDVGFKEDEIKNFGIVQENDQVRWNNDAKAAEIEIGPEAKKLLVDALEKSESLSDAYVALYDRLQEGGNHNGQVEGKDVA